MKKKIILVTAIALMVCGCSKNIPTLKNGDEAVVSFSKEKLSVSVTDLYETLKDKYGAKEIIDIIDKKILEDKYSKKLDEAAKEAEKNFTSIKANFQDDDGNYDEQSLLSALKQYYGYTSIDQFKDSLKINYLRDLAIKDYVKKQITDSEIKSYYNSNIVGDRKVSHIQIIPKVKDDMTDEEKEKAEKDALKKAQEIIVKLKKGEKFADLAKEYSDDEDTKEKGGDLGYINKGDYGSDEFDNEVWSLEVGKFSTSPVKTSAAYEIVYVAKEKDKKALKDVKNDIIDAIVTQKTTQDTTVALTAMEQLRKDYGLSINDDELKKEYNKYLDELYNNSSH